MWIEFVYCPKVTFCHFHHIDAKETRMIYRREEFAQINLHYTNFLYKIHKNSVIINVGMITYTTRLEFNNEEDRQKIFKMLEAQQLAWNECSKIKFGIKKNSIVDLHAAFYKNFRESQAKIPSQVVICAENECLSAYRSVKSNKHKIIKPIEKKKLSIRLDKRIYSFKYINNELVFSIVSLDKRVKCKLHLYNKLSCLIGKYAFCDPELFIKDNNVWIALTFNIATNLVNKTSACGIDLGIRMSAVTSEGKFYQDKKFNKEKRKLRYLKRQLQSKGTKSAKRHLNKLRRKEHNKNKNQFHLLANSILKDTKAKVIVLEDLSKIKQKKHKYQNKNRISQVSFYQLKQILTYKAPFYGKTVIQVPAYNTSQIDHRTDKKDGIRVGRRYYGKDGIVLDADQNAVLILPKGLNSPFRISLYLTGRALSIAQLFLFARNKPRSFS